MCDTQYVAISLSLFVSSSLQLAMEVAPCKPFSNMMDTAEIIACSFLVDSMVMTLNMQSGFLF